MTESNKFWQSKNLDELTPQEWEALCDGCGRCCLVKLEDEDTGDVYTTSVACSLFDSQPCRCTDYENRFARVPDCLDLDSYQVRKLQWLPATCAYRLRMEGKPLPDWHPLVSGTAQSVIDAGISVANQTFNENDIPQEELGDYLFEWPETAKNIDK